MGSGDTKEQEQNAQTQGAPGDDDKAFKQEFLEFLKDQPPVPFKINIAVPASLEKILQSSDEISRVAGKPIFTLSRIPHPLSLS